MPTLIFNKVTLPYHMLLKYFHQNLKAKNNNKKQNKTKLKAIDLAHSIYENVYALTAKATGQIRLTFIGESVT